jgi:hypothetical protein
MEFAFRTAVWQMGLQYQNTRNHGAEQFLAYWEAEAGLKPSFEIGAPFGEQMREVTPQGHVLIRKSSSKFYNEETIERMFERVISRSRYRSLKPLLDQIDASGAQKAKLAIWANSIEDILQKAGKGLRIETLEVTDKFPIRPGVKSYASLFDPETRSKSVLMFDDTQLITDSIGLKVLNKELISFKSELQESANE